MSLDLIKTREYLQGFHFPELFIEVLGWSQPSSRKPVGMTHKDLSFAYRQIAQLAGVVVLEVLSTDGQIPDVKARAALHKEISAQHHENILIFVDGRRTQSIWYWVKRQDGKIFPRDHIYVRGQPGDLFLGKLNSIVFDISEFDETGDVPLLKVTSRLKQALDVERVTKKFYTEFQDQHLVFLELIRGIEDDLDRRWYASVLLNRLMFIYFLQRKLFLDDGNGLYLQNKLKEMKSKGTNLYYEKFLKVLFFEGFAKPEDRRAPEANKMIGKIRYLNGGLFLMHPVEERWHSIDVPDEAFENLYGLFERYSWNLNDIPGGEDNEINPDVLGYIFEKYINQKAFGAYYTRPEITEYLCERTIHQLILDGVNTTGFPGILPSYQFDNVGDLLLSLDAPLCRALMYEVLPRLRLLDPACGSAAFLVAAMKTLINIYAAVIGKIEFLNDRNLKEWLEAIKESHPSINYYIKKTIITENLFGVDIMEEAVEIAKLRLFLALVAAANSVEDLEPLPNIEFNIMTGNSLIGLIHVDPARFDALNAPAGGVEQGRIQYHYESQDGELTGLSFEAPVGKTRKEIEREYVVQQSAKKFARVLAEKNRLVSNYRHASSYAEDLRTLRDHIADQKREATHVLNAILLDDFTHLGIKYEQATWDDKKNKEGKATKRVVKIADIEALKPFHWGFEFDEILDMKGGFDAIITNPPWEIFKPQAKEFFAEHSALVTKNKMTIKDFEKEQAKLMKNSEIRDAWVIYQNRFPYVSQYFRNSPQYKNQIAVVNGKKAGSDINLYKLFLEQCFNLIRPGGECGIVIPSGIYTDLGTKQLRGLLFKETEITGIFGFENRKEIFEGVHRSFKFVVLTFKKGGKTDSFSSAFMRHNVAELERFPKEGAIDISVDLIRRLSPDSLALMELKNESELRFSDSISKHPQLDSGNSSYHHIRFCREIDPTAHTKYFSVAKQKEMWPLLEGRNIHQFTHVFSTEIRFWISEADGRRLVLGSIEDKGQLLDYQVYRLGFRKIARNTDERTMISTVIPPSFVSENFQTACVIDFSGKRIVENKDMLLLSAIFNSFVYDAIIRLKVSSNMNFFFVYSTQVPQKGTSYDMKIVDRAARLICTAPEFDDLAKEVGLVSHKEGVTDPVGRAKLRAELDGLIAHLYRLTEEEFAYILTTFPLVPDPVKVATLNAYRDVERGLIR
jgi:Alw26I/Eco31I/Esp3I family type II restriction m6 adenine DNA methyltransferase